MNKNQKQTNENRKKTRRKSKRKKKLTDGPAHVKVRCGRGGAPARNGRDIVFAESSDPLVDCGFRICMGVTWQV